ncbi:uncharacterized protein ABDE67_020616 [Symphorus nematophorus]
MGILNPDEMFAPGGRVLGDEAAQSRLQLLVEPLSLAIGLWVNNKADFELILFILFKGSNEPHDDVDRKSEEQSDGITTSVILGALTVLLVNVIIGLVVKVRKLQKAASEEQKPQQRQNLDSDELKDADLGLYPTTIRSRRPRGRRDRLQISKPLMIY